jgi:PAS domain S-box-containing protein
VSSDSVLAVFVSDAETLNTFQTYKGWFYVLITALMLYGLISASEGSIRESEEKYRRLVESLEQSYIIYSHDTAGIFTYVSPSITNMLGYSQEDFEKHYTEYLTDNPTNKDVERHTLLSIKGEKQPPYQVEIYHQDRSRRLLEITEVPVFDGQGRVIAVEGIAHDITEHRQAEKGLQESEARYRTLFERANDGIFLMRQDQIIECNPAAEEIFGRSRNELIGISPADISPAAQRDGQASKEKALEKVNGALAGTPQYFEWVHTRPNGSLFDVEVSVSRVHLNGEWLVLALVRDITQRKQAEEMLQHYTDRLEILHQIDRAILAVQSPEDIAQAALSHIRQLIPCQRADVSLVDLTTNESMILAVDTDIDTKFKAGTRFGLEQFADELKLWRQGQVVAWGEPQLRDRDIQEMAATEGLNLAISVPLFTQGELIGTFNLSYETTDLSVFTQEHETIACQAADQLAIAIQQARLHKQVEQYAEELEQRVADRTRELSALYDVATVANESVDLQTTLQRVLERTLAAMRSRAGAIHLLDEDSQMLRMATHRGIPSDLAAQRKIVPLGSGTLGRVLERDEPLITDPGYQGTIIDITQWGFDYYIGLPMRVAGQSLGVLSVLRGTGQPKFSEEEVALLASIADQTGAVVEAARLRQLARQAAVLEERQRLARDLHDSVTQTLFSMTLTTEATRLLIQENPDRVADQLDRLHELAQDALTEMRSLVQQLRSTTTAQGGLVPALREHIIERQKQDGLQVVLDVAREKQLPPEYEDALFRIVQEGLNNVVKHAQTQQAEVTLHLTDEAVILVIEDDGVGFDPSKKLTAKPHKFHFGLATMQERAEMLGGNFTIETNPGAGTRIEIDIPLNQQE